MPLNEAQYELLTFIEQEYSITGLFPSKALAIEALGCSDVFFDRCLKSDGFLNALNNRGIRRPDQAGKVCTAQQISAVATMLDLNDRRSDSKKLNDMGIPTQTWSGWQRDPVFSEYFYRRAESIYGDILKDIPISLQQNVKRGDISSIKLVLEMTGRYSDKKGNELDLNNILMRVLEILQKYITNPDALMAASGDLLALSGRSPLAPEDTVEPLKVLSGTSGDPSLDLEV